MKGDKKKTESGEGAEWMEIEMKKEERKKHVRQRLERVIRNRRGK